MACVTKFPHGSLRLDPGNGNFLGGGICAWIAPDPASADNVPGRDPWLSVVWRDRGAGAVARAASRNSSFVSMDAGECHWLDSRILGQPGRLAFIFQRWIDPPCDQYIGHCGHQWVGGWRHYRCGFGLDRAQTRCCLKVKSMVWMPASRLAFFMQSSKGVDFRA